MVVEPSVVDVSTVVATTTVTWFTETGVGRGRATAPDTTPRELRVDPATVVPATLGRRLSKSLSRFLLKTGEVPVGALVLDATCPLEGPSPWGLITCCLP